MKTDDGIVIKGFRLVNGANRLFISAPNDKGKDEKYYESVILPFVGILAFGSILTGVLAFVYLNMRKKRRTENSNA